MYLSLARILYDISAFLHGNVIRGYVNVSRMALAMCPTYENINPTPAK